jgi:transposase
MLKPKSGTYEDKFKERAVVLARDRGNVRQAARELGVSASILHDWINADNKAQAKLQGKSLSSVKLEKQEFERMRKRLYEVELELEIIKKATAYFARESLERNTPGLIK